MRSYRGEKHWVVANRLVKNPIDQVLLNRSISLDQKEKFLNPNFDHDLYDPFLLKGMVQSVERIGLAMSNKERVGVFADYDADGVTSGSLLSEVLTCLGIEHIVYIPSREEGYGLNKTGIDLFKKEGISLMIAVDMGVTGKTEVEYATSQNIDTIIIDHHLVQGEKLPESIVINPKQQDCNYPFKELSACGLVFKFASAVSQRFPKLVNGAQLKWWLDIVAISTIADMVPLVDENRVLARYGLVVFKKTKRVGLKALCEAAGISLDKINTGTIGFQIAPRLNAPGRIGHANLAYALLMTHSLSEAQNLAGQVQIVNVQRQDELERVLAEARQIIERDNLDKNKVILVSKENWPPGLVGLVAGRLMEEFARPVIVLEKGDTNSRGSARSIEAFHLLDSFEHAAKYLTTFGGHARAGGLSLKNQNLDEFYLLLLKYANSKLKAVDLAPKLRIDAELRAKEISLDFINELNKLEPFGFGNSKPLFLLRSQKVKDLKLVGSDMRHTKFTTEDFSGIHFDGASKSLLPKKDDLIDIVCTPQINEWNNQIKIDLMISDWKLVGSSET